MGNCMACPSWIFSDNHILSRYDLKTPYQAKALKSYMQNLKIPLNIVDVVYKHSKDSMMAAGGHHISKMEFLATYKLSPTPFAVGALNTLEKTNKLQFFEFFASLHNYCAFDKNDLIEHTFNLVDSNGNGRLNIDDFILLVRHVYGDNVAKAENGALIRTHNTTDIDTAHVVMKHMDVHERGLVTLDQFRAGMRLHTNLIQPAFQVQRLIRKAMGGQRLWQKEEVRLHNRLHYLKHHNVVNIFHSSLKMVKDPGTHRASFNDKGVAGQGGLTELGDYDVHGNKRGKDGKSEGVSVSTYQHHSKTAELEQVRHDPNNLVENKTPKGNTYDDWRNTVERHSSDKDKELEAKTENTPTPSKVERKSIHVSRSNLVPTDKAKSPRKVDRTGRSPRQPNPSSSIKLGSTPRDNSEKSPRIHPRFYQTAKERSADRIGQSPRENSIGRPSPNSRKHSVEKIGLSPRKHIVDRTGLRPREHSADRAGLSPREHSANRAGLSPRERSGSRPREHSADRAGSRPQEHGADRAGSRSREHSADRAGLSPREHSADRVGLNPRERSADKANLVKPRTLDDSYTVIELLKAEMKDMEKSESAAPAKTVSSGHKWKHDEDIGLSRMVSPKPMLVDIDKAQLSPRLSTVTTIAHTGTTREGDPDKRQRSGERKHHRKSLSPRNKVYPDHS